MKMPIKITAKRIAYFKWVRKLPVFEQIFWCCTKLNQSWALLKLNVCSASRSNRGTLLLTLLIHW